MNQRTLGQADKLRQLRERIRTASDGLIASQRSLLSGVSKVGRGLGLRGAIAKQPVASSFCAAAETLETPG